MALEKEQLQRILDDPGSTPEERAKAREQIAALGVTDGVEELLQFAGKARLEDVPYLDAHKFCSERRDRERRWPSELWDAWLTAYFGTEQGRNDLARIAGYLRSHDFDEWKYAADEWKDSGFKDGRRLIEVLARISADPAHVHNEETRTGARVFLDEMRRRCQ